MKEPGAPLNLETSHQAPRKAPGVLSSGLCVSQGCIFGDCQQKGRLATPSGHAGEVDRGQPKGPGGQKGRR